MEINEGKNVTEVLASVSEEVTKLVSYMQQMRLLLQIKVDIIAEARKDLLRHRFFIRWD